MDRRLALLAARAADHHGIFTRADARNAGVSDDWRFRLLERAVLTRLGTNSFCFAGTPATWHSQLVAGMADLGPKAVIAGRPAGALLLLDGFAPGGAEFLVPRAQRSRGTDTKDCRRANSVKLSSACRTRTSPNALGCTDESFSGIHRPSSNTSR